MNKFRSKNMKKEDLIYKDDDYEIYKKNVDISGSLFSGIDLFTIALEKIEREEELLHLVKDGRNALVLSMIESLVKILGKQCLKK